MAAVNRDSDESRGENRIEEIVDLLHRALEHVDALGDRIELGARLQNLIDDLQQSPRE